MNNGLVAAIKPSEALSTLGPPFHVAYKLKEASLRKTNLAKILVFPGPGQPQNLVSIGGSSSPEEESDRERSQVTLPCSKSLASTNRKNGRNSVLLEHEALWNLVTL